LAAGARRDGAGGSRHLGLLPPYGIQRFTRRVSDSERTAVPRRSRVRAGELVIKRWRLPTWWVLILPFAVNLKRFLAPDLVFILGISRILLGPRGTGRFTRRHGTRCRAPQQRV